MLRPRVSIIIPTLNRASLLAETLDSVAKQSFSSWECIIVDDGSTDNTKEVVQKYSDKDTRFKLVNRPDNHKPGGNGARNYGFEISKGDYIQWFDSDDLMDRNKLQEQINSIEKESVATISFSEYYTFSNNIDLAIKSELECYRNYSDPSDYIKFYSINGYGFNTVCLLVHRELVKKTGGWNEDLLINQDGEFITKVVVQADKIVFADKAIAYYRMDSSGKMKTKFPGKANLVFETTKYISDYLMINSDFTDIEKYCATQFIHLKFLYPDEQVIWKKADQEIKQLGGKHFYIHDEQLFNYIWKITGLRSAFFYRRVRNFIKKQLKKLV